MSCVSRPNLRTHYTQHNIHWPTSTKYHNIHIIPKDSENTDSTNTVSRSWPWPYHKLPKWLPCPPWLCPCPWWAWWAVEAACLALWRSRVILVCLVHSPGPLDRLPPRLRLLAWSPCGRVWVFSSRRSRQRSLPSCRASQRRVNVPSRPGHCWTVSVLSVFHTLQCTVMLRAECFSCSALRFAPRGVLNGVVCVVF